MKKNLSGKHKDHKGKKLSRTNRSKLRRSKKVEEVFKPLICAKTSSDTLGA